MKRTITLGILLLISITSVCHALGSKVKPELEPAGEKLFDFQQITLDNGLNVVTLEDFSCPIVAVQVWYKVGSKDEKPDRQGYAHMFEHMMFKGTERVSETDHFNLIRKVGGTCNASTDYDLTLYVETLPADQIELALWLEAERMSFLKIDQHSFDTERKVVEEELRKGENRPYGTVYKKLVKELFKVHPYRWSPIGKLSHLRSTSVPDLREFWTEYYVPNNATLIIVGAVEHETAQELAQEYFGWIPAGPEPKRVTVKEPPLEQAKEFVIDDENAPAGNVLLSWRTVPVGHPDEVVLDFLAQILGRGHSSRLYRSLVAETQIAVDVSVSAYSLEQDGMFLAEASLAPTSQDYDGASKGLKEEIEKICNEGVTDKELEKARNQLLKSMVLTNLNVKSKARMLGNAAVLIGDTNKVNTIIDDIRAVTAEDVQRVAKEYLRLDRAYQFTIRQNTGMENVSKDDENAVVSAEPELNAPAPGRPGVVRPEGFPKQAPSGKETPVSLDVDYHRIQLPNGLKVLVVSNHEVPFISATLGLTHGVWTEAKPGTAAMAANMLTRGTTKYSESELAAAMDQFAISLSASAGMDTSTVNMSCLKDNLDYGILLLSEVVQEPSFEPVEFEKLLQQTKTSLSIQEQMPDYLAGKHFKEILFGEHPYARTSLGSSHDLDQLTAEDLKQWWSSYAQPSAATLIFAGDISKKEATSLAKKYFGSWRSQDVSTPELPALPEPAPTTIYIVDRPGSAQAQIHVGQLGLTRKQQPEYFISLLTSTYFGGTFHSRLNENIRVKRGLTYGAKGGFMAQNLAGVFQVTTFTKNESVDETIRVILEQIDQLQTVEPTDGEFYDTRSYFFGSFARNRETPQAVAQDLWLIESQRLGADYNKKLFKALKKATKEDCIRLTSETIDSDALAIVVVGDASVLKDKLSPIAPVQIIWQEEATKELVSH